jgi:tetratricopeptide (TPR) repeat protein
MARRTNYAAAAASLSLALKLRRDAGNRLGEAETLNNMADLALASGKIADAHAHYEQALAISTGIDARIEEALALEGMGQCHLRDGRTDEGAVLLLKALGIYQKIGSPNSQRVEKALDDLK